MSEKEYRLLRMSDDGFNETWLVVHNQRDDVASAVGHRDVAMIHDRETARIEIRVDAPDPSRRDRRANRAPVDHPGKRHVVRVLRAARRFPNAVFPLDVRADGGHGLMVPLIMMCALGVEVVSCAKGDVRLRSARASPLAPAPPMPHACAPVSNTQSGDTAAPDARLTAALADHYRIDRSRAPRPTCAWWPSCTGDPNSRGRTLGEAGLSVSGAAVDQLRSTSARAAIAATAPTQNTNDQRIRLAELRSTSFPTSPIRRPRSTSTT